MKNNYRETLYNHYKINLTQELEDGKRILDDRVKLRKYIIFIINNL